MRPETLEKKRKAARDYYWKNRERLLAYSHDYWQKTKLNPEVNRKHIDKVRKWSASQREQAIMIVGHKELCCENCGCNSLGILEINHKNGGGYREGYTSFYHAIVTGERKTDDLNLLCRVCNALHFVELRHPKMKGRFVVRFVNRE